MSRCPVVIRDATPDDVPALREVMTTVPPAGMDQGRPQEAAREAAQKAAQEAASAVARTAADPDQRLLVAVQGGVLVGAVLLVRAPLTPLHPDHALHVLHLHVREDARRHGVGRALMEAAVSWAEEKDIDCVLAVAPVGSRDANRFLARLGLGQVATVRAASVSALRSKLPVEPPAAARVPSRSSRSVGQVLALRRSQRRARQRIS